MIFCSDFCVQYFSVLNYVTLTWYITWRHRNKCKFTRKLCCRTKKPKTDEGIWYNRYRKSTRVTDYQSWWKGLFRNCNHPWLSELCYCEV